MRVSGMILTVLLSGALAWSQSNDTASNPRSDFSLYAGYSLLAPDIMSSGSENGWNAGIDIGISRHVGAAFDFSQYFYDYGLGAKTTPFFFMGGPRVWAPVGDGARLRPFADFLVGGGFIQTGRTQGPPLFNSSASFAWNAGGGVDIRTGNHLWFRGQAGYFHTQFTTWDNEVQRFVVPGHARVVVGILYRH